EEAPGVPGGCGEGELDLAGIATGLVEGLVQTELALGAAAGQLREPPQRHPELARVEHDVGAVVTEPTLLGDLHGGAAASGPADPATGGSNSAMSVRRPSTRADPTIAAVVPLGLLGQGLEELTHELFPRQALEGGQLPRPAPR